MAHIQLSLTVGGLCFSVAFVTCKWKTAVELQSSGSESFPSKNFDLSPTYAFGNVVKREKCRTNELHFESFVGISSSPHFPESSSLLRRVPSVLGLLFHCRDQKSVLLKLGSPEERYREMEFLLILIPVGCFCFWCESIFARTRH